MDLNTLNNQKVVIKEKIQKVTKTYEIEKKKLDDELNKIITSIKKLSSPDNMLANKLRIEWKKLKPTMTSVFSEYKVFIGRQKKIHTDDKWSIPINETFNLSIPIENKEEQEFNFENSTDKVMFTSLNTIISEINSVVKGIQNISVNKIVSQDMVKKDKDGKQIGFPSLHINIIIKN